MDTSLGSPHENAPIALTEPTERLPIGDSGRLAWFDDLIGGVLAGGIYLVGGSPGGRKSGLATQVVLELALHNINTVTILTEESEHRFVERIAKLTSEWPKEEARDLMARARADTRITDLDQLPGFLLREVLNPHGKYYNAKLIVVDSVQGHATPGNAFKKYAKLFEFDQLARSRGSPSFLFAN